MTIVQTESKLNTRALHEWRCQCGNLWQVLLSPKFPERNNWQPTCNCQRITPNQHYYHPSLPDTVLLAIETPKRSVTLKDLNRSKEWESARNGKKEGYFEGYVAVGEMLEFLQYNIEEGKWVKQEGDMRDRLSMEGLRACGVEVITVDLARYGVIRG